MREKTILFILPVATQPRYARRISFYKKIGYKITVASFEREYFSKNTLPSGITYVSLGELTNGNYLKRIPVILRSLKKLVGLSKNVDIVFMFSADILIFLSPFLNREKVYYEIGDIRKFSTNKYINNIYEFVYRHVLKRANAVFVTSVGFKKHLVKAYSVTDSKINVVENKLQKDSFQNIEGKSFYPLTKQMFTVGVIGLLRYENVISFLRCYKQKSPNFNIMIYGGGPLVDKILPFVDQEKVSFFGQFKYPDDLESIYESIDLSFTMYDANDLNVRLALPNKLYEAMYFKKPIIVSKGTYLEKRVKDADVGFSWDQDDMEGLVEYLSSEKFISEYNKLKNGFNKIKESDCLS